MIKRLLTKLYLYLYYRFAPAPDGNEEAWRAFLAQRRIREEMRLKHLMSSRNRQD
jgi:hypothetical protein